MVNSSDYVVWLKDIDRDDSPSVGGKNANLGEMIQAGFNVPPGFAVTTHAYFTFLKENKFDNKIKHLLGTINYDNHESLTQTSSHIRKLLKSGKIPQEIVNDVFLFYDKMSKQNAGLVAIRSSATGEDSKSASFAGQQETFLNIQGESSLIESIRNAWASLFETRAVFYRHDVKLSQLKTGISLVVQKMVQSKSSGVMFTIDPVQGNKNIIIIEAILGLGEYIVQGRVTPDHFEVDKNDFKIVKKSISNQKVMLKRVKGKNKQVKTPIFSGKRQKISDDDVIALAKVGKKIEEHYYFPQDIEWAKEGNDLYIVQTRPITTIGISQKAFEKDLKLTTDVNAKPILIGDGASPGIGIGPVRIIRSIKDISKMQKGEVLVAPFTNPDYVPAMKKAAAIITEKGGRTSHAAIVSREFGVPAIVGAPRAIELLKNGQTVTVNGRKGEVYDGSILIEESRTIDSSKFKTKTKVLVNLSEPELAEEVAQRNVDGIGLLRAEFMIAQIGIHPKKLIEDKKQDEFVDQLSRYLETICRAFYPRPIIYRATDFKTNEYRNLVGGKHYEKNESNPLIGYRGAFRYIHDKRVFELELKTIEKVRDKMGLNNLNLMIPFVRTVDEMKKVKQIINDYGFRRSSTFKLYMMAEIPSNVILIDDFIDCGIDGISIGSNDLTMLLLGIDRDNEEIAVEFNEQDKAVLWALERIVKTCKKRGISSSICGQAPSNFPSLVEKLVKWGITSISVSPDAIDSVRQTIYKAEKQLKS